MIVRVVLGLAGVAAGAWGGLRLLNLGWSNLVGTMTWVIGGVVLHDAFLAPLTLLLALALLRVTGRGVPAVVIVVGVILAIVTLVSVPVLGRYGARSDLPSLLDRNYTVGWLVVVAVVIVVAALVTLLRGSRDRHAAVDREGLPGDVAPGGGGQEDHRRG